MSRPHLTALLVLILSASVSAAPSERSTWDRAYHRARALAHEGQLVKAARLLKKSLDWATGPSERVRSLSTMGKVLEAAHRPKMAHKVYSQGLKEMSQSGIFPVTWIRGIRARIQFLEGNQAPALVASATPAPPAPAVPAASPTADLTRVSGSFASVSRPKAETSGTLETRSESVLEARSLLASADPGVRGRAIPMLEEVAANGDSEAMRMLGLVHLADALGARTRAAGVRFLELAADEGDAIAARLLRESKDPNQLAELVMAQGLLGPGSSTEAD